MLNKPRTKKTTKVLESEESGLICAYSSMQGWRQTMEDAHCVKPKLEGQPGNVAFAAVFDGHGEFRAGRERSDRVSSICSGAVCSAVLGCAVLGCGLLLCAVLWCPLFCFAVLSLALLCTALLCPDPQYPDSRSRLSGTHVWHSATPLTRTTLLLQEAPFWRKSRKQGCSKLSWASRDGKKPSPRRELPRRRRSGSS